MQWSQFHFLHIFMLYLTLIKLESNILFYSFSLCKIGFRKSQIEINIFTLNKQEQTNVSD